MRNSIPLFCCFAFILLGLPEGVAQNREDAVIFDEDDPIGISYYDASVGIVTPPSKLTMGGPGDKILIVTNQFYTGANSALLEWTSAPAGDWRLFLARPGFKAVNASGYSNLVLYVNGPTSTAAPDLPRIGLESSPPDVQTSLLNLGDYLPEGIDSSTNTWQKVSIPLGDFTPIPGFSLNKLKDTFFAQGQTDNLQHTIWVDNIRLLTGQTTVTNTSPPVAPVNLQTRVGDRSIVLHWETVESSAPAGFNIYRWANSITPAFRLNVSLVPIQSFADLGLTNDHTYQYTVRAVNTAGQEGPDSNRVGAAPHPFADDDEFLEYLEHTAFDYFWYEANPANGLVRDRSDPSSDCSIAAVGFGLTGIPIAIDRGWLTRLQGIDRTLTTLKTFWQLPQGTNLTGTIGYKGWFYHVVDMSTGLRSTTTELSSIDTALLLSGMLTAKQYFSGSSSDETAIRGLTDAIFNRVDWQWMATGTNSLATGWRPESGFIPNRWIGYNEAKILYLLGLGASSNALPPSAWDAWTSGYVWRTNSGLAFVTFPPLFGHQYSECWVDFRHYVDSYMRSKEMTYFENSRRATLAQRDYAIANPKGFLGYGTNVWGLTACDGPGVPPYLGYLARGTPPPENDDGTIASTAAASSIPFTPEYSIPALRFQYDQFLTNIWTGYGFRDAFNLEAAWWAPQVLGIDQGPILLMAENFRSGRIWDLFMRNLEVQRGLRAAGFSAGSFAEVSLQAERDRGTFNLSWASGAISFSQVEYSNDLLNWLISPLPPEGMLLNPNSPLTFSWRDAGPPATLFSPSNVHSRFYRVFELPLP